MTTESQLGDYLILSSLPGVGPARINWLLSGGAASEVVAHLRAGRLPPEMGRAPAGVTPSLVSRWCHEIRTLDGPGLLAEAQASGIDVIDPGCERWPFADDPEPPIMVFARGDLGLLDRCRRVAVVGTRRCTSVGREMAHRLGQGLAEAGLVVVSGLATGIDGAAHQGTLAAGGKALAVVGSGLDVVYPKANRRLWNQIASDGLLLSEASPGARPERWRFPARNRLIAALADVVVVVESHAEGGSLLTVTEAADRGVPVLAVPGSVLSPASVGSNQLLVDGCQPVCTVDDVLDAIGFVAPVQRQLAADHEVDGPAESAVVGYCLGPLSTKILSEVAAQAIHVDQLVAACREPIPAILAEVQRLEALGLVDLTGSTVGRPMTGRPPA